MKLSIANYAHKAIANDAEKPLFESAARYAYTTIFLMVNHTHGNRID